MNYKFIDEVRFYSRDLIREFGFLNDYSKWDDLNFAQIHMLLECEQHGVLEQQDLAKNLRVDKSYVNRLIKSLIQLGYITFFDIEDDKRAKPVALTAMGLDKVKEINDDARNQVSTALNYLQPDEQLKIIEGLTLYSSALKKMRLLQGVVLRPIEQKDNEQLCVLIKSVLSEFGANKPGFAYMDEETNSMFEFYQEPGKSYFVAVKENRLLGGIGFAPLPNSDSNICELKKMYLDKDARGLGLGHELLRTAVNNAKLIYDSMYLETLSRMSQAIVLYRKMGFVNLSEPMGDTGHYSCDTWMIKRLNEPEIFARDNHPPQGM